VDLRRGSNLPQRLLEGLGRLPAGNQVLAIDDRRRHRMDAAALEELFLRTHVLCVGVAGKDLSRMVDIQTSLGGQPQQRVMRADVFAIGEIGAQQCLLQRKMAAFQFGPVQQPVRVERVVDAAASIHVEGEA
jgi:hypothetical protein